MGKEVWDVCYFYLLTNQIGEVMWYAHNTTKKKQVLFIVYRKKIYANTKWLYLI